MQEAVSAEPHAALAWTGVVAILLVKHNSLFILEISGITPEGPLSIQIVAFLDGSPYGDIANLFPAQMPVEFARRQPRELNDSDESAIS
jgi:hypothetical protein